MDPAYSTKRLLALRKLTRAIHDCLLEEIQGYLATLVPLLRPTNVLGEYVSGHTRGSVKGADRAFKDLRLVWESTVSTRPFKLPKDLKAPIEIQSSSPELSPWEYSHVIQGERSKTVTVTSPLRWVISYIGFTPGRLRDLMGARDTSSADLSAHLLHAMVMHVVTEHQEGLKKIFQALHFPVTAERNQALGELPLTCISSSISTHLPPDEVIIESTEISGMDVFEEIVNIEDIETLSDSLRDRLHEIAEKHGAEINAG